MAEWNQVNWRGIRPTFPEEVFTRLEQPEGCTHVLAYGFKANGSVTVYTVPADTVFYLTDYDYSGYATAAGALDLMIRTDAAALYTRLIDTRILANSVFQCVHGYSMAIQLPAGYYFTIGTNLATITAYVTLIGYTRPV